MLKPTKLHAVIDIIAEVLEANMTLEQANELETQMHAFETKNKRSFNTLYCIPFFRYLWETLKEVIAEVQMDQFK